MKINTAKQKMQQGRPALGAAVGSGSPLAAEILSQAGFDWVLVDCQHSAWDDESAMYAFRSICLGPAIPMARVQQNDFYAIGRLLDRGALGIIVPMVNSVADAEAAARAMRYPPRGGRSWGPAMAQFYGLDYGDWVDDQVFLAVQIESKQAVEQAEAILGVEGVDGCWIGPADLARSLGVDINTPEGNAAHEAAILRVLEACRKTGKVPGIAGVARHGNPKYWIEKGFLFVTVGGDTGYIRAGALATLEELRR